MLLNFFLLLWVCRYLWFFSNDSIMSKDIGIDYVSWRGATFNLLICYHKLSHNESFKTICLFSNRFGYWKSIIKKSAGNGPSVFRGEFVPCFFPDSVKWQNSRASGGNMLISIYITVYSLCDIYYHIFLTKTHLLEFKAWLGGNLESSHSKSKLYH